jgi:hypothetical protein
MMKKFPIHDWKRPEWMPSEIPWEIVAPFERRAELNHGQSLQRLAERGGLCAEELFCLLNNESLRRLLHNGIPNDEIKVFFREKGILQDEST